VSGQGSIFIGTEGVMYSNYDGGNVPVLLPDEKFKTYELPKVAGDNHYHQFVEAARGNGKTSAPFDYAGPLTELVLLGCLATRFPKQKLEWDTKAMTVTNFEAANKFVKRTPRKGWDEKGL